MPRKTKTLNARDVQELASAIERGETVWVNGHEAHLRTRWVKCGKPRCAACPHGPYLYLVFREGRGRRAAVKERYVGRLP
ncbi:MAG: hypothetical protein P8Y25_00795 [Chromatiaceae bacterium]